MSTHVTDGCGMDHRIRLDEDWHVASIFSGAPATVEQSVRVAEARRLTSLCVVDRVRHTSGWVRDLIAACRLADYETPVAVSCGVEAELLDTNGTLDLPLSAEHADYVFAAADRLPTPRGPLRPEQAREKIEAGELLPARAVEWLVRASANAALRHENLVLARPFSILPSLGFSEEDLHPAFVRWLGTVMAKRGAGAEINERWRCAGARVAAIFLACGVTVRPGTECRSQQELGRYEWCRRVLSEGHSLVTA